MFTNGPDRRATDWAALARFCLGVAALALGRTALANPQGLTVSRGTATTSSSGNQFTVTASQNAYLNWQSFNIGPNQTTTFVQPSAGSVVWNQINSANPSQIFGNLNGNGVVVLMNSSGFYFGPNSHVNAAGFVASTAIPEIDFGTGSQWQFTGSAPGARIVNYGTISVQNGGSLFLIGGEINNHGALNAPGGNLALCSDGQVLISDRPDGKGLNITATLPKGTVENDGRIVADGGSILASAQIVNQKGLIQANSVREQNGVIELVAGEAVNLGATSTITANGDASGESSGGKITVTSGNSFSDATGSVLSVAGGAQGGNGGSLELSAPDFSSLNSTLTAAAQKGFTSGQFLLDPLNITLDYTGAGSAGNGTVTSGSSPGTTLDLDVNTAFENFSAITLQATANITLATGTQWNLSQSTGKSTGQLTLDAGNNIIFQNGSSIYDANNWSVALNAGMNFNTMAVTPGKGNIYLNGGNNLSGGGSIQTGAGSISLLAGGSIQTGAGSLEDANGNSISLASGSGSISVTTPAGGNNIQISSGFVETTAGGNISLSAGQALNVDSGYVTALGGGSVTANATGGTLTLGSGYIQTDSGSVSLTSGAGQDIVVNGSIGTVSGGITLNAGGNIQTGGGSQPDENSKLYSFNSVTGPISLTAGSDITFGEMGAGGGLVETTGGGKITLTAGTDLNADNTSIVATGGGAISVTTTTGNMNIDTGFIQTDSGDITLTAAQNITLTAGANTPNGGGVTTSAGGSINVTSVNGSVDTGNNPGGYTFPSGSLGSVESAQNLGGISTAAGGNVTITAYGNITSFKPLQTTQDYEFDPGSGAFGVGAPGNVTVTSLHGDVVGRYVVADGTGTITANTGNCGNSSIPLTLSLIQGSWNVSAPNGNIALQEVLNPNGTFNYLGSFISSPTYHLFDYGANDSVTLSAGNSVELEGSGPRAGNDSAPPPAIYPPSLTINAGPGGIKLDSEVILFPSPSGSLNINDAGSFTALDPSNPTQIILSDANPAQKYNGQTSGTGSFAINDDAATPIHNGSETSSIIKVAGDMDNIFVVASEPITIDVGGNMNNCAFQGQNLKTGDTSSINVAGNIYNQNNISTYSITLPVAPMLNNLELPPGDTAIIEAITYVNGVESDKPFDPGTLFGKLVYYNTPAGTGLALTGQFTPDGLEVAALENGIKVQVLNALGQPVVDSMNNPVYQTEYIYNPSSPGYAAWKAAINALNSETEGNQVPLTGGSGYLLEGPGNFKISANNIDLGNSAGIQSVGPLDNPNLVPYCYTPALGFDAGANIDVNVGEDLTMFSSAISSLAGGNVVVTAGGTITAGSALISLGNVSPRGIFTVAKSDVVVTAGGNDLPNGQGDAINLNGSRIAAYDGGNITVLANTGDIDAGAGGAGASEVEEVVVVPTTVGGTTTYQVEHEQVIIPGSGILAANFPQPADLKNFPVSRNPVGNITVTALHGDIIADEGGILQLPFNGLDTGSTVTVSADGTPATAVTPGYGGNIEALGSGIIGETVILNATAGIQGVVVASRDLNISAGLSVGVTAVAGGSVSVSAGGSISGTIVGIGGISASGSSIDASLQSENVSTTGATTGQVGFTTANVAGATSAAAGSDDQAKSAADAAASAASADDPKKKKLPGIGKVSRVTVILPKT